MLYAIICHDKPDSFALRNDQRPAHLTYLEGFRIPAAGPFLDDQERMVGSLIILEAASQADAERFAANDPYAKAGLFGSVEIKPWRWSINPPKA